jgi:pyruvate-formate lyase-activating enzyme
VETARGCRYRCSFCSVWQHHHGEFEVESPDRTIAELASLPRSYVTIIDDLAFSDIEGAETMADEILRRGIQHRYWAQIRADNVWPKPPETRRAHQAVFEKLAAAGLDMVLIGLESFDPKELKRVNKGSTVEQNMRCIEFLHSIGVRIWGAQIVFPEWDVDDFDRAIEINRQLGIDVPQFTILTPLPGTPDYERAMAQGSIRTMEPGQFDFFHSAFPTKLPLPDFYRNISRIYKETGWWANTPDGKLANKDVAIRSTECVMRDLQGKWTTRDDVRRLGKQVETLMDETLHLSRLEQVGEAVLERAQ